MIISASRRTDLPAFFPEETINKILLLNKSEQQTIIPKNKIEAVVFWTKNAKPILPYLHELDEVNIPYYFQYTMNDYPGFEDGLPDYTNRVNTFIELSDKIGKNRVIWRYDPFFKSLLPKEYTIDDVLNRFEFMGNNLYKYTNKLVFSFLDPYPKLPQDIYPPTKEEEDKIVNKIIELNKIWKLKLATCAETVNRPEIENNQCIDPILLKELGVDLKNIKLKDFTQRKMCKCYPSTDIGDYHTCRHKCLYCYAK